MKIERNSAQVSAGIILENVLLALGWSSAILQNGLKLDSKSTQIISEIFLKSQNSLKVLEEATELFKRLNSQGPGELAKWCAQTKGSTGLRQGDLAQDFWNGSHVLV